MSLEPYKSMSGILNLGRLANFKSWVFKISLAASGEEATSMGTLPRCINMSGPCFLDRASSERWGFNPSWWRFPMIGSLGGDGGKFLLVLERVVEIHLKLMIIIKTMHE